MDQDTVKALIKADIEKAERELKAKKILLKQASKKPSKPFIETRVGRGLNHVLATLTTPCAAVHRNARMRLDHPTAYRAEVALQRAEKLLEKLEAMNQEVSEKTNRWAAMAALYETILSEFKDLDGYQERVAELRQRLVEQAQRLRKPGSQHSTSPDILSMFEELKEKLEQQGPQPQE